MSDHAVQETDATRGSTMKCLSEDFRRVVERIQTEFRGDALRAMDKGCLATVDAAERTVDTLALELRRGAGNRNAWRGALVDYESAWLEVIRNPRCTAGTNTYLQRVKSPLNGDSGSSQ